MALDGHASPPMSPLEKLSIVQTLKKKELNLGDVWYVVSRRWYRRWENACTGRDEKNETHVDESKITPVDNADIADARGNIIVTPSEGVNVEFLPAEAWEHLVAW
jgi:ubiquitin carboxyl-terminal hydrolase 4/11/15